MTGRTLGHYRIEERLGAGGMGVVYKARDARLQRTVAIKFLSGQTATHDATRVQLLHEARAASALNHPHVCTVHEVSEVDGFTFIVMEFVEGRLLSSLIAPIGVAGNLVFRYGMQIASALEHAHDRGVVHRDLKSLNVIVTPDGRAKVLDFGVATRTESTLGRDDTRTNTADTAGDRPIGTLAYLAPEILLGQEATPQSDIWSLGVVLYEMACGRQPFEGRSQFDVTAAILRGPLPPLPADVSTGIGAVITRCLSKDPSDRYRHASQVYAALEAVRSNTSAVLASVAAPHRSQRARWAVMTGLLIGVAGISAWLVVHFGGASEDTPIGGGRLTLLLSSERPAHDPALSPDGKMLVYGLKDANDRYDLFVSRVAGGGRIQLTTDDAKEDAPAFSPDGERIAFTRLVPGQDVAIAMVPALGGDITTVLSGAAEPAWSPDGRTLAFLHRSGDDTVESLAVASVDGSNVRLLLRADSAFPFLRDPAWSPDGRQLAVVRGSGGAAGEIWLVPVGGGAPRRLGDDPSGIFSQRPVFTSDGKGVVYSSNRGGATNIWFRPLDGGAPVSLTTGPGPDEWVSVASDGTIAFLNSKWRAVLLSVDLQSNSTRTLATHSPYIWAPTFSPDGRRIAFSQSEADGSWHLWVVDAAGGEPRRLTSGDAGEIHPRFTPAGDAIVYQTWSPPRRIWRLPLAGGPPVPLTVDGGPDELFGDVSPRGDLMAFTSTEPEGDRVYVARFDGTGARRLFDAPGSRPRWSPDGQRIAFGGERALGGGVFVVAADGTGLRRLTNRGGWPVWWPPDGKRIAYLVVGADGNQHIEVVSTDGGASKVIAHLRFTGTNKPFDFSADGRFLVTSDSVHVSDEIWLLASR